MDATSFQSAKVIFAQACALKPPERSQFVQTACGGDTALYDLVQRVLEEDGRFFDAPVPALDTERLQVGPYRILEIIGEGGMGTVYLAEQHDPIRRKVALKVIRAGINSKEVLARFHVEQRSLALMNHPHIARVFDSGITPEGRPYFVMEYVPGLAVTEYCDRHRLGPTQRLELFLLVCLAVQHAHQRGVIHRDLKPSNILVMSQDNKPVPKIIDFGVAKATEDRLSDVTLHTGFGQLIGTPEYMSPEQASPDSRGVDTRSDVYSLGVILFELLIGTLPFESSELRNVDLAKALLIIRDKESPKPSQRLGSAENDISMAAKNRSCSPRTLLRFVRGDLDWITIKALEKDANRRYQSPAALAEDLERYLNGEAVEASQPGLAYRISKLVGRNKPLAVGAAATFVAIVIGVLSEAAAFVAGVAVLLLLLVALAVTTVLLRQARRARQGEVRQRAVAEERERRVGEERDRANEQRAIAQRMEKLASERLEEVLRLADVQLLSESRDQARELWPAIPDQVEAMRGWLESAHALAARLPVHEQTLETLRRSALPYTDDQAAADRASHPNQAVAAEKTRWLEGIRGDIQRFREDGTRLTHLSDEEKETTLATLTRHEQDLAAAIAQLEHTFDQRRTWRFDAAQEQWRHDLLAELVAGLRGFSSPDPLVGEIASVEQRIADADTVAQQTLESPTVVREWKVATAAIEQLPAYGGLQLKPQLGLIPLRQDPKSGLWEFWHVASGDRPQPNPDPTAVNPWIIGESTGLVMTLIPAGTFWMGSQPDDPEGPNHDPDTGEYEGPSHEASVAPFFLSRYEMTQGQWLAVWGQNPSVYGPLKNAGGRQHDLRHPVEHVNWFECRETLKRLDLELPTEEEWEYACRAGTETRWWSGDDPQSVAGTANLADHFARTNGAPSAWTFEDWLDDGYSLHAPVGCYRPNAFGLHDVQGNVWEWTLSAYRDYRKTAAPEPGLPAVAPMSNIRVIRGGAFNSAVGDARASHRNFTSPDLHCLSLGLRPARPVR
ncbi:MAG: bifunctional serine/threonine-protein kinase/formylglycine-generating enzyme family protein [Planctomycetota bacterium]